MTRRVRVLVLGRSGQVADALTAGAEAFGLEVHSVGRETADLTTADADRLLDDAAPEAVINAAAHTAVDRAEDERDAAFALNADMPGRFAQAAAARGVPMVQISTDYVFDGSKAGPYVEDDPVRPLGVYGASKAAGEAAVLAAGGRAAILRTAWVYGATGGNFVRTMLRLAQDRDELGVVGDQIGSPTWSRDVADGAARLARALVAGDPRATGTFHCVGAGRASWADLATAVFEEAEARGWRSARVRPITTAEFPTRTTRPANSMLGGTRMLEATGWRPGDWRERLTACFDSAGAALNPGPPTAA